MSDITLIGVDPGMKGALALLFNGKLIEVIDMPTFEKRTGKRITHEVSPYILAAEIKNLALACMSDEPVIIMEKVHSMPGQGVASVFAFGRSYGVVEGVVAALGYPMMYVTPNQWKKRSGLVGQTKGASRQLATETWPDCADLFKRVKDDGRADAALIARYGHLS